MYSGDSPSAPRVAEYGGNTHGFGSRGVLGKGWPKDLVKVRTCIILSLYICDECIYCIIFLIIVC